MCSKELRETQARVMVLTGIPWHTRDDTTVLLFVIAWFNVTEFTVAERALVGAVVTQIENGRRQRAGLPQLTQQMQPVFFQRAVKKQAQVSRK